MSARDSSCCLAPGATTRLRWVVELVLPQCALECRLVITTQPLEHLDLEAHATMATLLDWKDATPLCGGGPSLSIFPVAPQPLPHLRFLLGSFGSVALARNFARKLRAAVHHLAPPWSERTRCVFMHHLNEAKERA